MAKIFIVDDEQEIRSLLQEFCERAGHQCTVCANGDEALKKVRSGIPDMIISDLNMPGTNGLEMTKVLRASDIHCPIIIISGYFFHQQRALRLGVTDFLPKPFLRDQVLAKISEYLE